MKMVHITLHTACFGKSLMFYEAIIGLKIERDMRPSRNMVFLSDEPGDTCMELIEDENAQRIEAPSVSIGFHTEDVFEKHAQLQAMGLRVSEIISPNPHVKFFFVSDPNGLKVQLI